MSHQSHAPNVIFARDGHAHLYSLLRTRELLVWRGLRITLVDPSPYLYYYGMATGGISGSYKPGENRYSREGTYAPLATSSLAQNQKLKGYLRPIPRSKKRTR